MDSKHVSERTASNIPRVRLDELFSVETRSPLTWGGPGFAKSAWEDDLPTATATGPLLPSTEEFDHPMFEDDLDEVRLARESAMIDAMASVADQVVPTRGTWRHGGLRAVVIAVVCGCVAGWLLDRLLVPPTPPDVGESVDPVELAGRVQPGGR